jgi:uncharacterized membrane protein YfhO
MNQTMNKIKTAFQKGFCALKVFFITRYQRFVINLKNPDSMLRYVLYLIMVGVLFYGVALVSNAFTIPLSGDYVMQQIPFYYNGYDDWWHFFKTGEFVLWDSSTYLGSSNIGSNSFYYYMNPFFLPILIFPRVLVPQGLAVLMIGKMVGAGLVMRVYLKYFGLSEKTARLFGLVYAYCGWITYYLWFNHFMEVAIVFPLIMLGIEKLLKEKRPWLLSFAIFLMGITNYFFLVSSAIAGVMYALFRYFQLAPKKNWEDRFQIAAFGLLSFAVGIVMSALVFWPSIVVATTSNRVSEAFYLAQLKIYWDAKDWTKLLDYVLIWHNRYGSETPYDKFYPLISFLFPTVSDRSSTLLRTSSYDNTISSLFVYTPIMLLLIPSLLRSIRRRKFGHLLPVVFFLFALFTPFFYNLFHGFTIDYGRWQIFVVVSMIAYIAINYEHREQFRRWYYDVSFVIILGLAAYTFYEASQYQNQYNFTELEERFYVGIYQLAVIVAAYVVTRIHARRQLFTRYVTWFVTLEAIVMGAMTMSMHGLNFYVTDYDNGLKTVSDERAIVKKIQADDKDFFRVYNLNAGESSNIAMKLGYNGLTAFHSLYNFYLMEFNEWSHMNYNHNGWSMGYHEKRYNLDLFLNVKYYIMRNIYDSYNSVVDGEGVRHYLYQNVPFGFEEVPDYNTELHTVYRNGNFIEGGFSYDNIIYTGYDENNGYSDFYSNTFNEVLRNEEAYLKGGILRDDDAAEVVEEAPNLTLGPIPARDMDYASAKVKLVTCPADIYFDPYRDDDLDDCTVKTFTPNATVTGFTAHKSAIYVEPLIGTHFGNGVDDYFFALTLALSQHATVYLFNEENEIIVRDAHSFVNGSFKFIRGYYADEPVARIVIIPKSGNPLTSTLYYPTLYMEPYADYLTRHQTLSEYPLEDFAHTANTQTFTTDYENRRFIVLSTPYDPGWSVKATQADGTITRPTVYKAQGGFVGFLSEQGPTTYKVSYMTPYLPEGLLASLAGFALFGGSWAAVYLIQKKKKNRGEPGEIDPEKPAAD